MVSPAAPYFASCEPGGCSPWPAGPPTAASGPVSCSQEGEALVPKSASLHVPASALLSEISSHFHSVSFQWDPGLVLMENSSPQPMAPAADLCHPLRLFACPDHHPQVVHRVSSAPLSTRASQWGHPVLSMTLLLWENPPRLICPTVALPGAWCSVDFQ